MKTYTFTTADGKTQEICVTDEVYAVLQDLDKQEQLNERRETRRCQSLELSVDNGWDIADNTADTEQIVDKKEQNKELYKALGTLTKQQRELVNKIFFKGMTQAEVAEQENVSTVAIHLRLQVILKKLRKYFGIYT